MDAADLVLGPGGDDGRRPEPGIGIIVGPVLVAPQLVEAGEGQHAAVFAADVVGLLAWALRVPGLLPLVEAVRGEQAAVPGERAAEGRLAGHGLGPGVDQAAADRDVLGPEGHQPPANHPEFPHARTLIRLALGRLVPGCLALGWLVPGRLVPGCAVRSGAVRSAAVRPAAVLFPGVFRAPGDH